MSYFGKHFFCQHILCFLVPLVIGSYKVTYCQSFSIPQTRKQFLSQLENEKNCPVVYQKLDSLEKLGNLDTWENITLKLLRGDCEVEEGQYSQAFLSYQKALQEVKTFQDDTLYSEVINKMGYYYLETGNRNLARSHFEEALQIRIRLYPQNHPKIGDVYNNLGIAYLLEGDNSRALDWLDQSLVIRKVDSSNLTKIAQSLNNLGLAYQANEQVDLGISHFQKAIEHYTREADLHHKELGDAYLNLSSLLVSDSTIQQSIELIEKAIQEYQFTPNHKVNIGLCYNNLGNIYAQYGDPGQALEYYLKSLSLRREIWGSVHPEIAETYYNLFIAAILKNDISNALGLAETCKIALDYSLNNEGGRFDRVNQFQVLTNLLYSQADLYNQLFTATGNAEFGETALGYTDEVRALMDYLRIRYESVSSKINLADQSHDIAELGISICMKLYQQTDQQKYLHYAFSYSESSKALLLFESLQKQKAEQFASIEIEILDSLQFLEQQLAQTEKEIQLIGQRASTDSNQIESLKSRKLALNMMIQNRVKRLQVESPEYFELQYSTPIPQVATIQQQLKKENLSILSYFQGTDILYIFLITPEHFDIREVVLTDQFYPSLMAFENALIAFPFVETSQIEETLLGYIGSANTLYSNLVGPVANYLTDRLVIIPDGALHLLPMEALLSSDTIPYQNLKGQDYLLNSYSISYGFSVQTWMEHYADQTIQATNGYIGFAPSYGTNGITTLTELVYNEDEILNSREELGGKMLLNRRATKSRFIDQFGESSIVHLATHGFANPEQDDLSFLAFAPETHTSDDSHLLYTREIYALQGNVDLLILSACESGLGQVEKGEGMISLSRSFSFAGARSILSTRWKINDKTTSQLIPRFLQELATQQPKDLAFQTAVKNYIRNSNQVNAHPYYWSSFSLTGNIDPILMSTERTFKPWVVTGILFLIAIIILYLVFKYLKFRF